LSIHVIVETIVSGEGNNYTQLYNEPPLH